MTPVTLWSRKNQRGAFEFNHLDDGHASGERPAPKHPNHVKAWAGGQWKLENAWMNAGRVLRLANVAVEPLAEGKSDRTAG